MDEREDLHRNWIVVGTGGRYYIGRLKYDGAGGDGRPFNYVELEDAFEMLLLRGQAMKDGNITLSQQNVWITLPLCSGGVPMKLMWIDRIDIDNLSPNDKAEYIKFIDAAQENFQKNRAANAGLVIGNAQDLQKLGGRGRA